MRNADLFCRVATLLLFDYLLMARIEMLLFCISTIRVRDGRTGKRRHDDTQQPFIRVSIDTEFLCTIGAV
ncbi:MAG TPA: hypothetical protein PKM59_04775 [Thermodesulfobacteriota bacterium]|nr:hypothetical protein [Deltaproteobacteria bacterium]HNR12614.1 hypothetical protein [Thermodesulfobacteriota bacterium]HNU71758.1 hypothetical protein [Thermodesulfobacteriota bacterium]